MAKVTIIVEHGSTRQTIEQSTATGVLGGPVTGDRADVARLLLAAFGVAAKPYQQEIADQAALVRQFIAAFGFSTAADEPSCPRDEP